MKTELQQGKKLIKEFEEMKELAELKALSNLSLERPLNDEQYKRMKSLFTKYYGEIK